jgi:acyl-CoA synthetase (AMP-forming)/AMP-acid ligase II
MAVSILHDLFGDLSRRALAPPAIAWSGGLMTWRDLEAAAGRLADILSGTVSRGQRVGILSPNAPALLAGLLATWRLNAVAVPLNVRWRSYELERVLRDADLTAMLTIPSYQGYDFAHVIAGIRPSVPRLSRVVLVDAAAAVVDEGSDDSPAPADPLAPEIAALLYTSGTTGEPKGALITHRSEVDGARMMGDVLRIDGEDVVVFVIPIAHAFGLTTCLAALTAGCRIVLVDSSFALGRLVDAVADHRATVLHGSPTLFAGLHKLRAAGLQSLRTGFVAGAASSAELLRALDDAGLRVLNLYGMTEIGGASCCRTEDPPLVRYTTAGRALTGYTFRVQGGVEGEVQVRGPYITPGYYRRPADTSAAFDDGWFRTGDLGSLDEHGNLRISGRAKDVIKVAGLNVSPAEVEALLMTHPDVAQAAVMGVPHPTMGEVLKAFVVARRDSRLTPRDVLQFARSRIAGYKLPYAIQMLPELPLLATGKPDRASLARIRTEEEHAVGH